MQICKQSVKADFANAVNTYDEAAVVQKEILSRLLAKLEIMPVQVNALLDLGSGTGTAQPVLEHLFGVQSYFAMDIALPMLEFAKKNAATKLNSAVCGDAEALPYQAEVFDLVFSASTLQWCNDISATFADCLRILRPEGLFIFSLFGPDTLQELRQSFAQIDTHPRVTTFFDMHIIGDQLLQTGFSSPVMEAEKLTVEYESPLQLLRDLKATGATNKLQSRPRGLLTKRQINSVLYEYQKFQLPNGKFPATYEVVYGHAWKSRHVAPNKGDQANKDDQNDWQPITFS